MKTIKKKYSKIAKKKLSKKCKRSKKSITIKYLKKKKKRKKKMGGSLSKRQMDDLNEWVNDKPKKDRLKWKKLSLADQYNSMIESKKQAKINERSDIYWGELNEKQKQKIIDTQQDQVYKARQRSLFKLTDNQKDFKFIKNKSWLYPFLLFYYSSDNNISLEVIKHKSIDNLNNLFRPNQFINMSSQNKIPVFEDWLYCISKKMKDYNCRISKGFNNKWVPAQLKFNPYVSDLNQKIININNKSYSKFDFAEISYEFIYYEPKISEILRRIIVPDSTLPINRTNDKDRGKNTSTRLSYIDYCRKENYDPKECEFLNRLTEINGKTDIEKILNVYKALN